MKALTKKHDKVGLWLEEVPVPKISNNEVLVRVMKTAICGTDVHIYEWNEWAKNTIQVGMTVGHEYVGEIVEVGSDVKALKIGDIVTGEGHLVCGECRNCRAGRYHLCKDTRGIGVNINGCFAEYVKVPAVNIWKTKKNVPKELYSVYDPYGNAVHTALSFDTMGEDVLVTGAGPIGIMAAMICQHIRARNVVLTDVNPERIALAKKIGIKHVINTKEVALADYQKELGMREGFDVGLEMSGNEIALRDMITNMKHGGKIAMLGIQDTNASVNWNDVVFKCLHIKGIYGREMFETWYKMEMLIDTGLELEKIITHRFKFEEFEKGFELMLAGKCGKVVLDLEYLWEK
ncbi:MAG: L-threonine 3-dehydrogenase [Lachnospirales bacterium]